MSKNYIRLDEKGTAWIDDTNVKVIEVVLERQAHGSSPEEIVYQHYDHLTLAQVYAALAYYYDHQADFDALIEQQLQEYEAARTTANETPGRKRLRSLGKLP